MHANDIPRQDADAAAEFLQTYHSAELDAFATEGRSWLAVSYRDLVSAQSIQDVAGRHDFLDTTELLRERPDEVHALLEAGLDEYDFGVAVETEDVDIRITDLPDEKVFSVSDLWRADQGELCGVRGQVQKVEPVRQQAVELAYECQRCGTPNYVPVLNTALDEPASCEGCERDGPYQVNHSESKTQHYQLARVQEPPEEAKGGDAAYTDLPLTGALVDSVDPGDRAIFTGTQELELIDEDEHIFDPYLDPESAHVEETDFEEIDTSKYLEEIQAIANGECGDPVEAVIGSIAPKVHGHDDIKLAMALQLFGGRKIEYPDGARDRGDIHVLLMGGPGTAKSTLLEASEELSPRSTYASGKGASAAGMTAAAVRDDFGETEWALEAGALVMANKGIACVDEIDKIDDDARSSMHTALEGQRININKAGINATLPAETSLLAAGNPKYGRFDKYASESLSEQIDLGPTLLSRFDLIFLLQDHPDREDDTAIASHIIDAGRAATGASVNAADIEPTIPADVLRAYIAHAKQHIQPEIEDDDIADDLVESFVEWRLLNGDSQDAAVPVTFRKLEGVRRLAQASARLRLSETVERQDIDRARALVMDSMKQVAFSEEIESFDADMVEGSHSKDDLEKIRTLTGIIQELEAEHEHGARLGDVKDRAEDNGMTREAAERGIEKLKQQGEAYEPSPGCIRIT